MFLQGADAHKYAYLLSYRKSNNRYHITALSGHHSAPFGSYIGNRSSTKGLSASAINFSKGTLTIASTDSLVNASDITYYFEFL